MSKTPKTLTTVELNKILDYLRRSFSTYLQERLSIRNYCMVLLMSDAGLRVGEVVSLLQSDLILNGQPVKALFLTAQATKTNTERLVPLSIRIQQAIEQMRLNWWTVDDAGNGIYAFYTKSATKHITERQVQRITETASEELLNRPIHPHIFRHTFASRMMRITNARVVQQLLGHKRLTSTQIYTHPNQDDLKKAIETLDTDPVSKPVKSL